MANLIGELQAAATDPNVSIADLLRKAKLVASKLGQKATAAWIDAELNGTFEELPDYRKVPVQIVARHPYTGGIQLMQGPTWALELVNQPRPLPFRAKEIEDVARGNNDRPLLSIPPDLIDFLIEKLNATATEMYHATSRTAVASVLDAIRTRVLDWSIALEEAGIHGEGKSFSPIEKSNSQQIVVNMNGNIGNFNGVVGSGNGAQIHDVTQTNTVIEAAHAIAKQLREGATQVADADDAELLVASADNIEEAAKSNDRGRLRKALTFAQKALPKIGFWAGKAILAHELGEAFDLLPL